MYMLLPVMLMCAHTHGHACALLLPLLCAGAEGGPHRVCKPWNCYALYDDGLVFTQAGSAKILFVQLPLLEGDCCGAFLFGSHSGAGRALHACPAAASSPPGAGRVLHMRACVH